MQRVNVRAALAEPVVTRGVGILSAPFACRLRRFARIAWEPEEFAACKPFERRRAM
jgi:hypothetical protein